MLKVTIVLCAVLYVSADQPWSRKLNFAIEKATNQIEGLIFMALRSTNPRPLITLKIFDETIEFNEKIWDDFCHNNITDTSIPDESYTVNITEAQEKSIIQKTEEFHRLLNQLKETKNDVVLCAEYVDSIDAALEAIFCMKRVVAEALWISALIPSRVTPKTNERNPRMMKFFYATEK